MTHGNQKSGYRTLIERWQAEYGEQHGVYAVLAGFEKALKAHDDELADWYDAADVDLQLKLYGWVVWLLEEQAKGAK